MRLNFCFKSLKSKKILKGFFVKKTVTNVHLEAGDIIAFKGNSLGSWVIKIFTMSSWTHIGMMKSPNELFEVNVTNEHLKSTGLVSQGGPNVIRKIDMLKAKGAIHVFKRREKLNNREIARLSQFIQSALKSKTHYSRLKAANSANIPIVKTWTTIFCFLLGCMMMLFVWQGIHFLYDSIRTPYSDLQSLWANLAISSLKYAVIILAEILVIVLALRPMLLKLMYSEKVYRVLRKLNISEIYITDPNGEFCSNSVLIADDFIDGPLNPLFTEKHEPRPKDIVKLCKEVGFEEYRLK